MYTLTMTEAEKDALLALIVSAKDKNEVINDIGLGYLNEAMKALARLIKIEKDYCLSTKIPEREVERNKAKVRISSDRTVISSDNIDLLLMFFEKTTADLEHVNFDEIQANGIINDWFDTMYPSYSEFEHDYGLYNRRKLMCPQTNFYTFEYSGGRVLLVVYHNDICVAVTPRVE